jgi:alpha-tubulin suppressor-like RCC1 family protein
MSYQNTVFSLVSFGGLFSIPLVLFLLIGCSDRNTSDDGGAKIIPIAAQHAHSLALDNDGKVYGAGNNEYGQLGLVDKTDRKKFTAVLSLKNKTIIAIAVGSWHSLALDNQGKVYAAGRNEYGQLGLGDSGKETDRVWFEEVSSLSGKKIIAIAAGSEHSIALANDGKVYAAGINYRGQLGLGDRKNRKTFTEVSSLSGKKIIAIAAGSDCSFAIANGGKVYAAGINYNGQLGLGNSGDINRRDQFTEISSLSDKKIIATATHNGYSHALDSDGKVYATGRNSRGQLGLGDKSDRDEFTEVSSLSGKKIIAIAAGGAHSLVLDSDGKIYATGSNSNGQLGLLGDRYEIECEVFTKVTSLSDKNITAIVAGSMYSFVVGGDDKIYATGWNYYGQLGLSGALSPKVFTEVKFNSEAAR